MNVEALLNALPEATLLVEDRAVAAANRPAGALFGTPTDALVGCPFATLFDEPPGTVLRQLDLWYSSAQMLPAALRVRRADGSHHRLRCSGARLAGERRVLVRLAEADTASRRFLALNERLTEMAREARVVAAQQQWLEALLDLMPTPMLQVEMATARILFRNRAAIEMRVPNAILPLARVASGEKLSHVAVTWDEAGTARHALLQADVLPAMLGRPETAVVTLQDVTALKLIEQELHQASRLKDEFLATVSHELRTPLNAIVGWASMLRNPSLDAAGRKRALESIDKNARAQTRVIEDLLDVSRITAGQLRLELRPTPLAPAIEAALDSVRPTAAAKQVELRADLADGAALVCADPGRMQQIVWNLLSNAVKFTPTGGCVAVSVRRSRGVEIVVTDTGPGIDPAFLPRIFDRFTQADGSSSRLHSGLGLGLAIARHLAELHGGTIDAHSDGPGCGATFTVRLPDLAESDRRRSQSSSSA